MKLGAIVVSTMFPQIFCFFKSNNHRYIFTQTFFLSPLVLLASCGKQQCLLQFFSFLFLIFQDFNTERMFCDENKNRLLTLDELQMHLTKWKIRDVKFHLTWNIVFRIFHHSFCLECPQLVHRVQSIFIFPAQLPDVLHDVCMVYEYYNIVNLYIHTCKSLTGKTKTGKTDTHCRWKIWSMFEFQEDLFKWI